MADFTYDKFKLALFDGFSFDPLVSTIAVVLCNETGSGTTYTPDQTTDEFLSDIPAGARIATSNLSSLTRTVVGNKIVIDAADLTISGVSGSKVDSLVFYVNTGVAGTSRLIMRYTSFTGLPFTPTGGDLAITLPSTVDKLLSIADA